VCKKVSK